MMSLNTGESLDTLWGARAIASYVGLSDRQAYYLLETGQLPGRKIGDRWVASREGLRRHLLGGEAA
jgi:hypothetical protein